MATSILVAPEKAVDAPGIAPEPTTPMKVSEAIRLGAMTTKPSTGYLRQNKGHGRVYACAIGAAAIAYGVNRVDTRQYTRMNELMQGIDEDMQCPVAYEDNDYNEDYQCSATVSSLHCTESSGVTISGASALVVHLNDAHQLPREWIADFLESLGY